MTLLEPIATLSVVLTILGAAAALDSDYRTQILGRLRFEIGWTAWKLQQALGAVFGDKQRRSYIGRHHLQEA